MLRNLLRAKPNSGIMNVMNPEENPELTEFASAEPGDTALEGALENFPYAAPVVESGEPAAPLTPSQVILAAEPGVLKSAIDNAVGFLDLADLDAVSTVNALRGTTETAIRDRIQMANSVLVLLANYGSINDDEALVGACELYAEKMKTIIKRLCI